MKNRILNKRRNRFIHEYKKLKQRNPEGNHKTFFSFDYLGYSDFCDCYFMGTFKSKRVLFNASFHTLRLHVDDLAYDLTNDKMDELFPKWHENHISWGKNTNLNEWFNEPEENHYKDWPLEQFYNSEKEKIRQSIFEAGIEVQPFIEVLPDYEFGIGLSGTFNCTTFAKEYVGEIIDTIKTYTLSEYTEPIFFGEKKKFYVDDLKQIQHSTPLIFKR
jgi:hypothetical protein